MIFHNRPALAGLALALGLIALAPRAHAAPITYDYTGSPFTTFSGGYNCGLPTCSVHGSMTLALPLMANRSSAPVAPLSYSFTDGQAVFTSANSNITTYNFYFTTNAQAGITGWLVELQHSSGDYAQLATIGGNFSPAEDFSSDLSGVIEGYTSSPGAWTIATASEVPEPASWALLATGVLLLLGFGMASNRRQKRARAPLAA